MEAEQTGAVGQTVELVSAGSVIATARTDAEGRYGFVLERAFDPSAVQVRLAGGVLVPVTLRRGSVSRAPTLTRTWYLAGHAKDNAPD